MNEPGGGGASAPRSQTLSRGIGVLELLAAAGRSLTIDEIASRMGLHRSIVYRIVRTLQDHRLLARETTGGWSPGPGLAVLAHSVSRELQDVAVPELAAVAERLAMTAFVVVHDGGDCITLASVEPRNPAAVIAQRPGTRHPLRRGAPGIALLTALGEAAVEDTGDTLHARVAGAAEQGYATSHGEVIPGMSSVAVPVPGRATPHAAVAVVYLSTPLPVPEIAARLAAAATAIGAQTG